MKLKPSDQVTVNHDGCQVMVSIQDASKGDVILGRVEEVLRGNPLHLSVGSVHEFKRADIAE